MAALRALWRLCQKHAQCHRHVYHKAHDYSHLAYLSLVAFHGPYHVAALVSLVIILIGAVLKLEEL